jgi:hypothetical protein
VEWVAIATAILTCVTAVAKAVEIALSFFKKSPQAHNFQYCAFLSR